MRIEPYLFFNGRCEEALHFYQDAVGASIGAMMRFKDSPEPHSESCPLPSGWENKIMHSNLTIGESTLMASDGMGNTPSISGISLCIAADNVEQAERLFAALSEGGKVDMPLQKTFWAKSFGVLSDRFGVSWMINCEER